jgi:hypothetical protein
MKRVKIVFTAFMIFIFFFCCKDGAGRVENKGEIDRIKVIKNIKEPLEGTVKLEIEKIREINPYKFENVGLSEFHFARDTDGEVVLFSGNKIEAHRFSSCGKYIGSLLRKGQGPGEFPDFCRLQIYFVNNQIWATGARKLSVFSKAGHLIHDYRLEYEPEILIDSKRFFVDKKMLFLKPPVQKKIFVNLSSNDIKGQKENVFFEAQNVGTISGFEGKGFMEGWATPLIDLAYDRNSQRVYLALNTEYRIIVKNLRGESLFIIEKPYDRINISKADKKKILEPYINIDNSLKWMISAYPDTLIVIKDIKILPHKHLAVYRVIGPRSFEIDVFDPRGIYIYKIEPPLGINLENAKFYTFGFSTIEQDENGFPIYVEYKINNLNKIFN